MYEEALKCHYEALDMRKKTLPPEHPDIAVSFNNIGLVYYRQEKLDKAIDYFNQTLEIEKKIMKSNNPSLIITLNNIGYVYASLGQYDQAFIHFRGTITNFKFRFILISF